MSQYNSNLIKIIVNANQGQKKAYPNPQIITIIYAMFRD